MARLTCSISTSFAYKESRQKRLVVKHRKYNLKIVLLQYFIDTTANSIKSHFPGGINLDSLSSRKHTTYVPSNLARSKRLIVKHRKYNLNTAILHCFIAAYNARLYSFGGVNLDSLNSRKHTTYVLARLKRNLSLIHI